MEAPLNEKKKPLKKKKLRKSRKNPLATGAVPRSLTAVGDVHSCLYDGTFN